ncbi:MAG: hypothetical protein K2O88_06125 [Paramuribaculum sp.]|nr:hypothetical protein [Paramuribaculum sp.]
MNPTVDTLTKDLLNEWQNYFQYWSATHSNNSEQAYRAFTHNEIAQAQRIFNRLQQLDDCFCKECHEYSNALNTMSNLLL